MNKPNQNAKLNLSFLWLMITIVCVVITYYCVKVKATNNYKTILHTAAESCSLEVVKFIVENIVDVNNTQISDFTVLHNAADVGCLKVVKFLLEKGANINTTGRYGGTALHYAAGESHLEVVRFLLQNGANPNIRANDGRNPRDVAVARSRHNKDKPYDEIISLLYNAEKQVQSDAAKP
ncbi:ankyrin repeat domain-containing protein [Candidatus Mesenet endosymbiont of Phosphuga atrata]|uniref:ankyrin repeat domain-containing protein n=1 Tax=Candidatus Mesenet endosymbiont of Phosphuga atrata TaxID=3066221 RepID=UPI0030CDB3B4